jgi:HK97 gp10 family phage protein
MSVTINDNTQQVLSALERAKRQGLEAIGMTAEGHAKRNTPVDTGRLRNSITHTADSNAAYIGTNVEYAPYVELGARGRKPVHMLTRAATEHKAEYKQIMENALKNG